jgi:hypothetical protein
VSSPSAADGDARDHVVEIPFEIASNKPWVQVRINGSEPRWFILDTGCRGTSVIARRCAEELHLALEGEQETSVGAGEGVRLGVSATHDVTLDVGGSTFTAPLLAVFPFDHVEPYEGRALDGLLGEDFVRLHVLEIDYARRKIRLYDPASFAYSGRGASIPVAFDEGLAVAHATLTPPRGEALPCRVVIDTGVRTTVIWYHPFVLAHDLVSTQPRVVTGTIGGGAGGETKGDIGRIAALTIGSLAIPNPAAVFSRDTSGVFAGSEEDGIVGGEILRRCKLTLDYAHERIFLEPYAGEFAPFEYDMSGMFLVSAAPDFRRVIVQSVAEGTPAGEAGLAKGDEIVAVDGQKVGERTLDDLRELFKASGAIRRVSVKRGAEQLELRLTLRPLV